MDFTPIPSPDFDDAVYTAYGDILGIDLETAKRILATASALVENYASEAPQSVRNESVIRCGGWLAEQPAPTLTGENFGPVSANYRVSLSALRHSGAMAILSAFKKRRGGVIS